MEDEQVITTQEAGQDEDKKPAKWLTISAVVVLILLGGYIVLNKGQKEEKPIPMKTADVERGQQGSAPENRVIVSDYSPGNLVNVEVAKLAEPGFVVVHADDEGVPGTILGVSKYLSGGEYFDVSISLSDSFEEGDSVHVVLHMDDGDGVFSSEMDKVVYDDEGGMILESFLVGSGDK